MSIDKLNGVQKSGITYTATKYVKADEKEMESGRKTDSLTLSKEAQQYLARKKEAKNEKFQSTGSLQLDILKRYKENAQKKEKKAVNMQKCYRIAARIGNGDKVPMKDMKFLRENAPELYKNALLFKKHNPEPKKYKSCLDKEDEEYMRQHRKDMSDMMNSAVGADDAIALSLGE